MRDDLDPNLSLPVHVGKGECLVMPFVAIVDPHYRGVKGP